MTDFRRWILALSVLALCVVGANAQVNGGSGGGAQFTCTAINGAFTPTVRQEGITELAGDIVITCTGGNALTAGATIPQANITVFLNTQVTSRLLGNNSVTNASEAMLLIDEPNSGLGGYGPTVPMSLCNTPASGCVEYIGNTTTGTNVPVTTVGGSTAAQNVFQGVVNPDGKSLTFFGVPIEPVGTTLAQRIFRITNLRINANNVPAGSSNINPGTAIALVSLPGYTLQQSQVTVAFVTPGLTASRIGFTSAANALGTSGLSLNQCSSTTNSGAGTPVSILRYASNFGTAFKTRVVATGTNNGQSPTPATMFNPTTANNSASESGLVMNGALGTTAVTGLNGANAGLADFGTRFKAVFSNIPSGVSIYVTTANVTSITNGGAMVTATTTTSYGQLIVADTALENGSSAPILSATGSNGNVTWVSIPVSAGTATAAWEVINSITTTNQNFDFGVYVSYSAGAPTPGSQILVSQSYAPIGSTSGTVLATAGPIPRFVDPGTYDNKVLLSINFCTTNLLFPYVLALPGFDTGMAISNTSMDPFGTATQTGACTLNWYTSGSGAAAATATTIAPTPIGVVTPGTTWANVASAVLPSTANTTFQGYVIAQCNFQYGHGYAAITDIGSRGILTSYLALVLNSSGRGGTATETLSH